MKLFTFATSPYARKVRMVLEYKGIECEMVERCYSLDRKPDLREVSERAEVPVLVLDDGRTIADSTIICEYLEDASIRRPPVFPADAFERARMRAIDDLCDRTFRRDRLWLFPRRGAVDGARVKGHAGRGAR